MDGLKRLLKAIVASALFLGAAGCGSKQKHTESQLTHAYRLIDAQKDDEAIAYLDGICPETSDNNECRVALASAYAHKAGIKIQKFVSVISAAKSAGGLDLTYNSAQVPGEISQQVDGTASHIASLLSKYAHVLSVYTAIPTIKDDDAVYMEEAINIMENLPQPRQTDALYRAVLKIIYLKHMLATEVIGVGTDANLGPDCILDLGRMIDTVNDLGRYLISVLDDLALANPSKAKAKEKMKAQVASEMLALTTNLSSTTVLDDAGNLYLKHLVIEQGFGKLLKCTGAKTTP